MGNMFKNVIYNRFLQKRKKPKNIQEKGDIHTRQSILISFFCFYQILLIFFQSTIMGNILKMLYITDFYRKEKNKKRIKGTHSN